MSDDSSPEPYIPVGEGILRESPKTGYGVLVYPDRLSRTPPGGVRTLLGATPLTGDYIESLDPLTVIVRRYRVEDYSDDGAAPPPTPRAGDPGSAD